MKHFYPEGSEEPLEPIVLARPKSLDMTSTDAEFQHTIEIYVENFKEWLKGSDIIIDRHSLTNSLRWHDFVKALENIGYLNPDNDLLPRDTRFIGKEFREGRAAVHIKKNNFNVVPSNNEDDEISLFDLFKVYLDEQMQNRTYMPEFKAVDGQYALSCLLYVDITRMSQGDQDQLYIAKPYVMPTYQQPKPEPVAAAPSARPSRWEEPAPEDEYEAPRARLGESFARITKASTKTFVKSAIGGALLTTTSRIAIVGGLSLFGVGAAPAGILAGVAIGAWKVYSNYKKHGSGVQTAFGAAATVGGVALGAFGIDALIEPFKDVLEPLAQGWIIDPLRGAFDTLRYAASTLIIDPIKNNIIDPVSDYFTTQASLIERVRTLQERITTLEGEKALMRAHLDALSGEDRVPAVDANVDAVIENRAPIEPHVVKTLRIGPDNNIIGDVTPLSDLGAAAISATQVAEAAGPAYTTHVIGGNDSLYKVVANTYGVKGGELQEAMRKVITANPGIASNPSMLRDGLELKLPTSLDGIAAAQCDDRRFRLGRSGACVVVPRVS